MGFLGRILGRLHGVLGRSSLGIYLVTKLGHQCDAVKRARLSDGPNAALNGEFLILRKVAPSAQFFVDVGANVGDWAMQFLGAMEVNGRGLLFEPSPEAARLARQNLRQYMLRLEIIEAAAGETAGHATFFAEPGAGESSSMVQGFSRPDSVRISVQITTLDDELERRSVPFVDFVKIDAEGFDLKVLKGARRALERGRIGIVQFEYNAPWAAAGSTLAEAVAFLGGFGYDVFLLKADGLHRWNYPRYGEYFGYSNFVAVHPRVQDAVASLVGEDL